MVPGFPRGADVTVSRATNSPVRRLTAAVVLCTYNGREFIDEQIKSILMQQRPVEAFSLFDDVSSDGTYEYLRERYAGQPVRVSQNARNLGYALNFEQAILSVREDIVFLSDQDDRWHPDKTETVMALFEGDDNLQVVFGDMDLIDRGGAPKGRTLWQSLGFLDRSAELFSGQTTMPYLVVKRNLATGASMALRTSFARSIFPSQGALPHDRRIAICAAAEQVRVAALGRPLGDYRIHAGQQIGDGSIKRTGKALLEKQISKTVMANEAFVELRHRYADRAPAFLEQIDEVIAEGSEELNHLNVRDRIRGHGRGRLRLFLTELARGGYKLPNEWRQFFSDARAALLFGGRR
jgi:glycosyltransferase involved in cell wall biosynthesis